MYHPKKYSTPFMALVSIIRITIRGFLTVNQFRIVGIWQTNTL